MNIVLGTDSFYPILNGVTTHVSLYAHLLTQSGHRVLIIAPEYPDTPKEETLYDGVLVKRFPSYNARKVFFMRGGEERFVKPSAKKKLYETLDNFSPTLIHCHTEFSIGHKLKSYAKKNDIPLVMTAHTYFEYYMQFYFPWLPSFLCKMIAKGIEYHFFKHADCLITPTEGMKRTLERYNLGKTIHILPTGLQEGDYDLPTQEELFHFKNKYSVFKYPVLLFVGRITTEKNVLFLLESFQKLSKEYPTLHLVYVGRGFADKQILHKAKQYGVQDRVVIYEPVPRKDLKLFYYSCKLFTFPSLSETQGLVVLEALAIGKPVVVIDAMGVGETMGHENFGGLLSKSGDIENYTKNIKMLLSDDSFYEEKCSQAITLSQKFHIVPLYQELLDLYNSLL